MKTFLILLLVTIKIQTSWLPKILWTYWEEQILDSDHSLKIFAYNHKYTINKDWEYRFLNKNNCWKWIDQIPGARQVLKSPEFQIYGSQTKRSKFIRLALLKHFGGVWIDYTTILLNNLDWLYELNKIDMVENKKKGQPKIFLIYNKGHGILQETIDQKSKQKILLLVSYQSFFIAAEKSNKLITEWYDIFVEGNRITRQKIQKNIQIKHNSQNIQKIASEDIWVGGYNYNNYYECELSLLLLLQRKQRQFDQQWNKNKRKKSRKLVTKYYGIWTASAQDTGYKLDAYQQQFPNIIMENQIGELRSKNIYPEYFIKLNHYARGKHMKRIDQKINILIESSQNQVNQCPIQSFMMTNTIFYQYLLKYYPMDFVQDKIFDESDPNYPVCPQITYKFHKSIQIIYSENQQNFIFTSELQYQKYKEIIKNKVYEKRKSVPFSEMKKIISTVFPEQNQRYIFLSQKNSVVVVQKLRKMIQNKQVFVFGMFDKIIINHGQSNIQQNMIKINGFQFYMITLIGYENTYILYIFKMEKNIQIVFESSYAYLEETFTQPVYEIDEVEYNYEQNISKQKQKEKVMMIICCILIGVGVIITGYILLRDQRKQEKFDESGSDQSLE